MKSGAELELSLQDKIHKASLQESLEMKSRTISEKFQELILLLEKKYTRKVVILIDEYDKPILDNITNSERAREMRDGLRNFYSVIKGADAHI
ncbi:MAG: hypothetical protein EBS19_02490, partial [Spirochaetia bacterium]|nr:hypothetical protein [Spirochaetia bacterium]